ncbi:Crp/Fnr family transcriptional regulator [Kiloniella sp. b19]|uniref:Crp/Fnr family transcriptional regulator n=1 Tax=Kiloniella sp. GXU_MW_B19 TaxID=3141326 RepID=UPI0031E1D86D
MPFKPCDKCSVSEMALCNALGCDDLKRLSELAFEQSAQKGETIINEADPASYLFNVTSGALKLYKLLPDGRRQITGFLFPGDFMGIAMNDCYAYSAEVVENCTLCRFSRPKLEKLMRDVPDLEHRLLNMVSNELVLAQEQMLLLGRKTAQEKVASFIKTLYERSLRRNPLATSVPLPMSRSDIGDYLGLTTETVSRTFSALKKNGVISIPDAGFVQINDPDELEDLSSGC